jgi:hypothetical protein
MRWVLAWTIGRVARLDDASAVRFASICRRQTPLQATLFFSGFSHDFVVATGPGSASGR